MRISYIHTTLIIYLFFYGINCEEAEGGMNNICSHLQIGTKDSPGHDNLVKDGDHSGNIKLTEVQAEESAEIYIITSPSIDAAYITKVNLTESTGSLHDPVPQQPKIETQATKLVNTTVLEMDFKCPPLVSKRYDFKLEIEFQNCPRVEIRWEKICGTGELVNRKYLWASTGSRWFMDHAIIQDGALINSEYENWYTSSKNKNEYKLISRHENHFNLYFKLVDAKSLSGLVEAEFSGTKEETAEQVEQEAETEIIKQEYETPVKIGVPVFLGYDENMIYPNLYGPMAAGHEITIKNSYLTVEFNCLGIEGSLQLLLEIPIKDFLPINLSIKKECSKETLLDKIQEFFVEEEEKHYGAIVTIIIVAVFVSTLFILLTAYNMVEKGDNFFDALPLPAFMKNKCAKCFKRDQNQDIRRPSDIITPDEFNALGRSTVDSENMSSYGSI